MPKEIKYRWWILSIVTVVCLFLDVWTKYLAEKHLAHASSVRLVGRHLELVLIHNRGAVFGIDPQHFIPGFPVNGFFTVFMIIAIICIIVYYRYMNKNEILMHWALAVILPGAIGNLYDRLFHPAKGVVDFIKTDLGFWPFNPWPIFNLADTWITIGVGLLLLTFLLDEIRKRRPAGGGTPGSNGT